MSERYGNNQVKRRSDKSKSPWLGFLFTFPSIVMMLALLFIPMGYSFYMSLFNTSLTKPVPEFIGLAGYIKLFKDPLTFKIIGNAIIWTVSVVLGQSLIGMWAALSLNRKFPGRTLIRGLVVLPWVIPGVVAAMIWKLVFDAQLGFLNNLLRSAGIIEGFIDWLGDPRYAMGSCIVVAVWKGFGFSALMFMAGLQGISKELYEAAEVDGAGTVSRFIHITLPGLADVISMTLILTGIWTFNYFEIIYNLTGGGPLRSTHIMPTYIYEQAFRNFNMGSAARYAVISIVMVGIASIFYIRRLKKQGKF